MRKLFDILISAMLLGVIPASIIITTNVKQAIVMEVSVHTHTSIIIP